ncbi:alpha/beta fold hydrolase [Cryptosporangium sp. NPDC051539]|uniref:alpha/beta fold hydrolase n=1 Tax=Cryptosporangium sp. NPDC051539 TaxID=3363962 RepID=UPI0037A7B6AF
MSNNAGNVFYVEVPDGRIAYESVGRGPLVVLCPGMADSRSSFRLLAPLIARAGYRVVSVDLRGHGASSTGFSSYNHADTATDLLEVVGALGGPAVLVGQSFSGGAVTIAAATTPDAVSAIVEIDPFTRPPAYSLTTFLRDRRYRRGAILLGRFAFTGSLKSWLKYLDLAYPGRKPADWDAWLAGLEANLREPGRKEAAQKMAASSATLTQAGAQLADIRCPALVVMGREDSDFPDPEAEAAAIVEHMPAGTGRYVMLANAGHYPHAEYPEAVADLIVAFLADRTRG